MFKKKFLGVLFVVLVLAFLSAGISFDATEGVAYGSSETNVSGIISLDTTWTKANSPYSLTGPVLVNDTVTLTIEPGVTVNFNGYYIRVDGTLTARGSSTDKIHFNGGQITGSGCIIENAILNSTSIENSKSLINNINMN